MATPNFCYKIVKESFDPASMTEEQLQKFAIRQAILEHIRNVLTDNNDAEIMEVYYGLKDNLKNLMAILSKLGPL